MRSLVHLSLGDPPSLWENSGNFPLGLDSGRIFLLVNTKSRLAHGWYRTMNSAVHDALWLMPRSFCIINMIRLEWESMDALVKSWGLNEDTYIPPTINDGINLGLFS